MDSDQSDLGTRFLGRGSSVTLLGGGHVWGTSSAQRARRQQWGGRRGERGAHLAGWGPAGYLLESGMLLAATDVEDGGDNGGRERQEW